MRESFVGVDVAKAELVVACRPAGPAWTASNDAEGIAGTVARLQSLGPRLIVLEATGGYERAVVAALAAAPAQPGHSRVLRAPRDGRQAEEGRARACMRKLLTILNAMMRTNTTWLQSAEVPA